MDLEWATWVSGKSEACCCVDDVIVWEFEIEWRFGEGDGWFERYGGQLLGVIHI